MMFFAKSKSDYLNLLIGFIESTPYDHRNFSTSVNFQGGYSLAGSSLFPVLV